MWRYLRRRLGENNCRAVRRAMGNRPLAEQVRFSASSDVVYLDPPAFQRLLGAAGAGERKDAVNLCLKALQFAPRKIKELLGS